ncbi:MAG TPA: 16S rRNA (adenine(1518)-N(6)/adenine(1519)-N(6))-dimethyltransferase RsmA [Vicinamibacterales bacterium]|nr:16S rRNA (adenine(1518)-N(6)/adenine(1519)-N(6))-dimethyltransferase RsmA [Vicinamibacterales bacterium]
MVRARKRFGQHFLEPAWVAKLVAAIAPQPTERFIEIGPGRGAITGPLAARADWLVAVEVDRDLAARLEGRGLRNVTVVTGDVLDIDLVAIARTFGPALWSAEASATAEAPPIRLVGNLPYNISTPILFKLLEASTSGLFKDATLMLQKEVADRLIAKPGTGDYGVLTISAMMRADAVRLLELPPGAFRPAPKVRSSVVRLDFRPPPAEVTTPELLVDIVRSVFTQRRKTISNALAPFASARGRAAREALAAAGLDPSRRPETLTLAEYARLATALGR